MKRNVSIQIITANDLLSGLVVYLTAKGGWVATHAEAALFDDPAAAKARLAEIEAADRSVVGPYLAEARPTVPGSEPVHFREVMRSAGPGNRRNRRAAHV